MVRVIVRSGVGLVVNGIVQPYSRGFLLQLTSDYLTTDYANRLQLHTHTPSGKQQLCRLHQICIKRTVVVT